jgi:hypothetical protein
MNSPDDEIKNFAPSISSISGISCTFVIKTDAI